MARISTYATDTDVSSSDRLLGTEFGSDLTKNYTVRSIGEHLRDRGIVTGGIQLVYSFRQNASDFSNGEFMLSASGGNAVAMSAITSIAINKTEIGGLDTEVLLRQMFTDNIAIYGADVKNTFGEYEAGAITENATSLIIALTPVAHNGSLVNGDRYYISKIPQASVPIRTGADVVQALSNVTPIVLADSRVEVQGIKIIEEGGVSYTLPDPDENANSGQGYILYTDATGNLNWKEFPLDQVGEEFRADGGQYSD